MSLIDEASISPTTLRVHDEEAGRKRKRDETEQIEVDLRPFTIKVSTISTLIPRTLTPICLLARAQLPLSHLDTSQQGSRLFSAHIHALEAAHEYEGGCSVLIAEEAREKRLYAIERAQRRTYALCRLGLWVKRESLEGVAQVELSHEGPQVKRQAIQTAEDGGPWWSRAAIPLPGPRTLSSLDGDGAMPHLAMTPNMETVNTTTTRLPQADIPSEALSAQPDPHTSEAASATPMTSQDVLQDLAKHYLDTLYLSRTSLAYFTKGPLSRARAALAPSASPGSGLQAPELIAFLRDAVLTASVMDKKYRDGIADIVKDLPSAAGLETPEQPAKTKKKRKWKSKRDKAGFFADEGEYVAKWWRLEEQHAGCAPGSAESVEIILKRRIPRLRSRETYLQINLALEVLALEASIPQTTNTSGMGESLVPQSQGQETQAEGKKPAKAKKLQDLPTLLETLIERVCIWNSLSLDSSSSPDKAGGGADTEGGNDELKNFCTEIVIPFYMSRIPLHAATVNKKLGGPSAPTPAVKRSKSASIRKPGEPAVRQAPERGIRKPLSRVTSEALIHSSSRAIPSLHRSATDTDALLAHIKRENSAPPTPLDAIPAAKMVPQPRKRTSLMHSMSFNRREVDLSAMSQVNAAKARKKAEVEEKLREAISTLKKPNRAMAVREGAEGVDESFAKATARSRYAGPGAQRSKVAAAADGAMGVHVTATPARNASRTVKATPSRPSSYAAPQQPSSSAATTHIPSSSARLLARPPHSDIPPSSSTFAIPQTGHRPRHSDSAAARGGGVEETPSRGFARFMPPGLCGRPPGTGILESPMHAGVEVLVGGDSPSVSRKRAPAAGVAQTPTKPVRSLELFPQASVPLVAASPNLMRTEAPAMRNDEAGLTLGKQEGKSVYDALGWEDEYEELT